MHNKYFRKFLLILALLIIAGGLIVYTSINQSNPSCDSVPKETNLSPTEKKVEYLVRCKIEEMTKKYGNSESAARRGDADNLSTHFVRIDRGGRIQLQILLVNNKPETLAKVQAIGQAEVEIIRNEPTRIQAWVPFDLINNLSQLPFVLKINLPSYAIFN